MQKPKFDTQFFERYARATLVTLLGDRYACLVNADRPDLQDADGEIGIEVTRAMRETRVDAVHLINDMAAYDLLSVPDYTPKELLRFGYTYGLSSDDSVGGMEYGYWRSASTLSDIIANKVRKVQSGFYGSFAEFGLYLFSREELSVADVVASMTHALRLQDGGLPHFSWLYMFDTTTLYVCSLEAFDYERYSVSEELCRRFFAESLRLSKP